METPLVASLGMDSGRKMPLTWHFPASKKKSGKALIKHCDVCEAIVVTQLIFSLRCTDQEFTTKTKKMIN